VPLHGRALVGVLVAVAVAVVAAGPWLAGAATWVDRQSGRAGTDFDPGHVAAESSAGGAASAVFTDQSTASGVEASHQGLVVPHEGRQRFGFPVTGQAWQP